MKKLTHGIKQRVHLNQHRVEHGRIWCEIVGCGFVAVETHFLVFVLALLVWAVQDILALLGE